MATSKGSVSEDKPTQQPIAPFPPAQFNAWPAQQMLPDPRMVPPFGMMMPASNPLAHWPQNMMPWLQNMPFQAGVAGMAQMLPSVLATLTGTPNAFPAAVQPDPAAVAAQAAMRAAKAVEDEDERRQQGQDAVGDAAAAAEEAIGEDIVYEIYTPKYISEGVKHPDPVVETASLAGVSPPPPSYSHRLQDVVAAGALSSLQLEAVVYANMRHEAPRLAHGDRPGFFLGDAAGVGKGRQCAGMVLNHFRHGRRRAVWLSVSRDLKVDAQRDLRDLGREAARIPLWPKSSSPTPLKGTLRSHGVRDGVLFWTYSLLVHGAGNAKAVGASKLPPTASAEDIRANMVASVLKSGSRAAQLLQWLRDGDADPLLILDECHKAKNLLPKDGVPTQTALVVVALQAALPNARVVYASATGASEPVNLGYMTRLGSFGFSGFMELLTEIDAAGMGAMEMLALGLKSVGAYLCRSLAYTGAEFELSTTEIPAELSIMYNRAAEFWQLLLRVFEAICLEDGAMIVQGDMARPVSMRGFWGAHQRFFRSLIMSLKVPATAAAAMEAVHRNNMCVCVGLQSTGQSSLAQAEEDAGGELTDMVSTPQMVLKQLIESQFPTMVAEQAQGDFEGLYAKARPSLRAWMLAPTAASTVQAAEAGELSVEQTAEESKQLALRTGRVVGLGTDADVSINPEDEDIASDGDLGCKKEVEALRKARQLAAQNRTNQERRKCLEIAGSDAGLWGGEVKEEEMEDEDGMEKIRKEVTYEEVEDMPCMKCMMSTASEDNDILLCDGCDDGWHMWCLTPQLALVPEGDWFCPKCVRKKRLAERTASVVPRANRVAVIVMSDSEDEKSEDANKRVEATRPQRGGRRQATQPLPKKPLNPAAARPTRKSAQIVISDEDDSDNDANSGSDFESGEESADPISEEESDFSYDSDVQIVNPPSKRRKKGSPTGRLKVRIQGRRVAPRFSGIPTMNNNNSAAHALLGAAQGALDKAPVAGMDSGRSHSHEGGHTTVMPSSHLKQLKKALLTAVDALELPPNPLDHLIDLCGGHTQVAEMTGRQDAMMRSVDGMSVQSRAEVAGVPMHKINLHEQENFQSGRKLIAVISEAASSGISLQADRRVQNQRRRLHITLELPWSADRAIQQFGRTHRSNQVVPPVYRLMVTPAAGEVRFASSAAKRLQALGALLKADRRAMGAGSELKSFDIDNKYGRDALRQLYGEIAEALPPMNGLTQPKPPSGENFGKYMRRMMNAIGLDIMALFRRGGQKDSHKVAHFLNKLLGLALDDQQFIFEYFTEIFAATVRVAQSTGKFSEGLVELKAAGGIHVMDGYPKPIHTCSNSGATTSITLLRSDRGISAEQALEKLEEWKTNQKELNRAKRNSSRSCSGFWIGKKVQTNTGKPLVLMALEAASRFHRSTRQFRLYRPNNGDAGVNQLDYLESIYQHAETASEIERAQELWKFWYKATDLPMGHRIGITVSRNIGTWLLTGAVLPVWKNMLETYRQLRQGNSSKFNRVTVVRLETVTGERIIGLHPTGMNEQMVNKLVECIKCYEIVEQGKV